MKKLATLLLVCAVAATAASADVIANWTFETNTPPDLNDSTTSPLAIADAGTNAASSVGSGLHAGAATDWSTPAGNGSANSFSSNTWATGDYYQFTTSTLGFSAITFGWDQTRSGTGPGTYDLAWSLDGVTFETLVNDFLVAANANPPGFWNGTNYFAEYTFAPVALPTAADNQAIVYVRLINQITPAAGGTCRVDNVLFQGVVPEPTSLALLALGALAALRRR